jgi:hypothetical protein
MSLKAFLAIAAAAVCFSIAGVASAGWGNPYFGPGTMHTIPPGPLLATSGSNSWTNNRVYRPLGYHFYLGYNDGSAHYSADNTTSNPFVWPAYGYNYLICGWDAGADSGSSVSPVTCEPYS